MSKTNVISLTEALNRSNYDEYIKDKVKEFIIENNKNYQKDSNVYLTKCFNQNIFVIVFDLLAKYKNVDYIITILIYIPTSFPNELRIYFQKNQNFIITEYYQNSKIIDDTTVELNYDKIINFIPLQHPLSKLINALTEQFNREFPLLKTGRTVDYIGPCFFDAKDSTKIEIKPDDLKEDKKIDETRKKLKDKILKNLEEKLFEMQTTQSQLESIKNEININSNDYYSRPSANNELEEMNLKLIELKSKLENDIQKLMYRENIGILDKCEEVVEIKNKEKFKYTIMKKSIEDFLRYINKAFEKKIITFRQAVDETRKISKELFFVTYLAEKNI